MNTGLDAERMLALSYVPGIARERLAALWAVDVALGQVLAGGREPMIGRIKLAWWREALEALDAAPAPAQPVLQKLAVEVLPAGLTGTEIAGLEEGWSVLATPERLDREQIEVHASRRGGLLFALSARLLRSDADPRVVAAGELWALADVARHSSDPAERALALTAGCERLEALKGRWPVRLRPLSMLAMTAARDLEAAADVFEPRGSPRRMMWMLRHRLTGR